VAETSSPGAWYGSPTSSPYNPLLSNHPTSGKPLSPPQTQKPPLRCQFCSSLLLYIIPSHTSVSSSLPCPRTSPCPSCTCGQSLGPTDRQGSGLSTRSKLTAAPVPIPQRQIPVSPHPNLSQTVTCIPHIQYLSRNSLHHNE
jgi:hypothetical protein